MTTPRTRPWTLAALVVLALLAADSQLWAAPPSAADVAQARSLAIEGFKLRKAGQLKDALEKFRAAYELAPTPNTGVELAKAYEDLGQVVEAREAYRAVTALEVMPRETAMHRRNRELARKKDIELEARIPRLSIELTGTGAASAVIRIAETLVSPVAAVSRPTNPGRYVVEVGLREGPAERREVVLELGDRKTLRFIVSLPTVAPGASSSTAALSASSSHPAPPATSVLVPSPAPRSAGASVWSYIGFGVGGAALVAGTVTGIWSLSLAGTLRERCQGGLCPPESAGDLSRARALGTASTVSFVVAGAGAGVGLLFLLLGPPKSGGGAPVQVGMSPSGVTVGGTF